VHYLKQDKRRSCLVAAVMDKVNRLRRFPKVALCSNLQC